VERGWKGAPAVQRSAVAAWCCAELHDLNIAADIYLPGCTNTCNNNTQVDIIGCPVTMSLYLCLFYGEKERDREEIYTHNIEACIHSHTLTHQAPSNGVGSVLGQNTAVPNCAHDSSKSRHSPSVQTVLLIPFGPLRAHYRLQ
jgi:hypothetical protein